MKQLDQKIKELKKRFEALSSHFGIEGKKQEVEKLEEKIKKPGFWDKEKNPGKIKKRFSNLKDKIKNFNSLKKKIEDVKELNSVLEEEDKENLKKRVEKIEEILEGREKQMYLSGKYDDHNVIFSIYAGAGGRDAEDWVSLLLEMYKRFFEKKDWSYRIISRSFGESGGPEGRVGVKEVTLKIKGKNAFGLLKEEAGVHRLVRQSPFSSDNLRHTSFAKVEVVPEIKTDKIEIDSSNIEMDTFRASGPGGQYVNTRESAVRVTHTPTGIKASSQAERLQGKNKKIALQVLASKLKAKMEESKEKKLEDIKTQVSAEFGNQIRSYVFDPYEMVKDHRTEIKKQQVEEVLDGNLDDFIEAEIRL